MNNPILKKLLPHFAAIGILLVIAFIYYLPSVGGKVLDQYDNTQAYGMQAEMKKVETETGKTPLWTNAAFSGMPTYMLRGATKKNMMRYPYKAFLFNNSVTVTHTTLFLAFLSFYFLLVVLGVDWRLGIIGAIGFGMSSYFVMLADAGHSTKIVALSFAPAALAGFLLIFKKKYLLGGALAAFFLALQIFANHIQITYYLLIILGVYGLIKLIEAFKTGEVPHIIKTGIISILAVAVALGSNLSQIWPAQEYAKESIRGTSELTQMTLSKSAINSLASQGLSSAAIKSLAVIEDRPFKPAARFEQIVKSVIGEPEFDKHKTAILNAAKADKQNGLDKGYAFGWSYGVMESFTLMFPNFAGGGSGRNVENTETFKRFYPQIKARMLQQGATQKEAKDSANQQVGHMLYWGDQMGTTGPVYYGAVICFLFFVGAFLVKSYMKWWLVISSALILMLSWGSNFPLLNFNMFEYFPFYNKFRSVSMILGLGQITVVLLGILGLQELFNSKRDREERKRGLVMGSLASVGLCILVLLISFMTSYTGANDLKGLADGTISDQMLSMFQADRASMLQMDVFRALLLVCFSAGALWMYLNGKLKAVFAILAVGVLSLFDLWSVDWKYMSHDKFITKTKNTETIQPTPADQAIMADKDPHFRVYDLTRGGVSSNATASYFHKSLSGYSAAKLMLYNEMADVYLYGNPMASMNILNMLNVKYIINKTEQGPAPVKTDSNLGNAWFVNSYDFVNTADEEIGALAGLDTKRNAIFQKKYEGYLSGLELTPDSLSNPTNKIELTSYNPDRMTYKYSADKEQLAMFSEIYYKPEKGWKVFLDGQPTDGFIKGNFLLRAMRLPAGTHELEMRFEPQSFYLGETVALILSLLVIGLFLIALVFFFRSFDWNTTAPILTEEMPTAPIQKAKPKDLKPTKSKKKKPKK